jgi:hypothetical protein
VVFRFGDHMLDIERRGLRRGAEVVGVGPRRWVARMTILKIA